MSPITALGFVIGAMTGQLLGIGIAAPLGRGGVWKRAVVMGSIWAVGCSILEIAAVLTRSAA